MKNVAHTKRFTLDEYNQCYSCNLRKYDSSKIVWKRNRMSEETKLLNGLLETEDAAILKNSNFRRCLSDNLKRIMFLEHCFDSAESGEQRWAMTWFWLLKIIWFSEEKQVFDVSAFISTLCSEATVHQPPLNYKSRPMLRKHSQIFQRSITVLCKLFCSTLIFFSCSHISSHFDALTLRVWL